MYKELRGLIYKLWKCGILRLRNWRGEAAEVLHLISSLKLAFKSK